MTDTSEGCTRGVAKPCGAEPAVLVYTLPVRWYPYSTNTRRFWIWHFQALCVDHFEQIVRHYDYRLVGVL